MRSAIILAQIQTLETQVKQDAIVFYAGSEEYKGISKRWSAIGSEDPGVVICPLNAGGVSMTVGFARENNIDLAVQCGRHSTDSSASTDGGILIDMSYMKQVTVNKNTSSIRVQGGALWRDVNEVASQHGLAVVGGTVSQVGVGGLTLRGGNGYLTPEYGLVIDNLLSATVVMPDDTELAVSAHENPDIFWAIRGAGQTVGVVTEFEFKAHPQPDPVWSGIRSHSGESVLSVMCALNSALAHPGGKAAAQAVLALSPDTGSAIVSAGLFFNGPEDAAREHFTQLLEMECLSDDVSMREYADAGSMLDPVVPPGGRKKVLGVQMTLPMRPEFVAFLLETIERQLVSEPDMKQSFLAIDYMDPSSICRVPVEDTAFPSRGDFLNGALILQWNDPEKDKPILSWGEGIQKLCENELRQSGREPTGLVSNFVGYTQDNQTPPVDMFGINAQRLLNIKAKYDPDDLFNKLNPLYEEKG
ncbi:hypothetical protein N7478_008765 [Penicillium angulare]|uniref:uncharacterized protein n=1 Tax=Penicillium angulare TaxID=116970 RepID=UPI00254026EA|nr:uncharacterized protein N7478_008765 [Penicillium angulare]KAJ5273640.1 hypothetical protein N7478_008765 [Penicillium angulare]